MDNYAFDNRALKKNELAERILKEQLLKEYILGAENDFLELYKDMVRISETAKVTTIVLKPDKTADYSELSYLKNIALREMGENNMMLCTILTDAVLIVTQLTPVPAVSYLHKIRRFFASPLAIVYSGDKSIKELPDVYVRLVKCMDYRFYAKSGAMFISDEVISRSETDVIEPDCGAVERALRCGDADKVHYLIFEIFRDIEKVKPEPIIARTYCMELFVCIIRCCESEKIDKYMKGLTLLQEMKTLFEIKEYILSTANEIVANNSPQNSRISSALIRDTLEIIDKNVGNENLSLSWIAGNVLYTNVDYLGKLFKKETGKNFSAYVMEKRMELAKSLILADKKDKIYEVAEKVGYGSNSQYFSQVFKKYTGVSPITYKEISRVSCSG